MGGRMPSFDSQEDLESFSEQIDFETLSRSCSAFWIPIQRVKGNGSSWIATQEPFAPIQYLPWADGQPESEYVNEDCVFIYLESFKYYDIECKYMLCSLCQIKDEAIFKLKVCFDMSFDHFFPLVLCILFVE